MRRNPFKYSASSEIWWRNMLSEISGYQPKTTFFADLSIAECFGQKAVQDTYVKALKSYRNNIVYITELVLCLNHKIWQLHQIDEPMAKLYDDLWRQGQEYVIKHFKGEDLSYYYNVTD